MTKRFTFKRKADSDAFDLSETALRHVFGDARPNVAMQCDWRLVSQATDELLAEARRMLFANPKQTYTEAMKLLAAERPLCFAISRMDKAPTDDPSADVQVERERAA